MKGVRCIDCAKFDLPVDGELTRHGFGPCRLRGVVAMYKSAVFEHECPQFVPADAHTIRRRRGRIKVMEKGKRDGGD
jgi:hypothetical protein